MNSHIMIQTFRTLPLSKKILFRKPREMRDFHLHCALLGGGHEMLQAQDKYSFNGLKRGNHYFCNFQFCLAGQGQLKWQNQSFSLLSGDLFLTEVPHNHLYYLPESSAGWEFVYLTLAGSELRRIVSRLLELNQNPIFYLNCEQSQLLWNILYTILVDGLEDAFFYSGKVYQLLLAILSQMLNHSQNLPLEIYQMQEYIYANFQRNIGIPDISCASGLSENYAIRLFKRHTGKTIHQFMEQIRLTQAQSFLRYSTHSIKEISDMVGFNDHNYFIRVFRRRFGITPGKFRRM